MYRILVVFTSCYTTFDDMDSTIDKLKKLAKYPCSIIFCLVGTLDYNQWYFLD